MRREAVVIPAGAALHFILSVALVFTAAGAAVHALDSAASPTLYERALQVLSTVLLLPIFLPASEWLPQGWHSGPGIYLLIAANSLVWSAGIYFLVRAVRRARRPAAR